MKRLSMIAAVFWAVALLALGWQLGGRGLNEPDEGRSGGIAREMADAGTWLMPRLYGHAHLEKPPLLYWAMRAAFALGGRNEWMVRLPSASAALLTLLLTAALAARLRGAVHALPAAAMLLASPLFFAQARIADYNMLLTLFTTLALWSAWAWQQDGRPWQRHVFHLALALAFLDKGPVGPVLVLAGLALYRRWPGADRPWRPLWHLPSALACVFVSLSWHVGMALRHPELWHFFVGDELVGRVVTDQHDRANHPLIFFLVFPLAIAPWLPALGHALANIRTAWRTAGAARLLWLTCGFGLALFTASSSRLPSYVLPLLPLACIALSPEPSAGERAGWSSLHLVVALALAALVAPLIAFHGVHAMGWPASTVSICAVPAIAAIASLVVGRRARGARVIAHVLPALLVGYLSIERMIASNETRIQAHNTCRALAAELESQRRPGDHVALLGRYPRGLSFYAAPPISVYLNKFPLQVRADAPAAAAKDFDNPAEIFATFDGTGRVFLVASPEVAEERQRLARRPVRRLYQDDHLLLISNGP